MIYGKWTDKIAGKFSDIGDRLSLSKEAWIHIGMAVGIAVVISAIILVTTTPRISKYLDDVDCLFANITTITGDIDGIHGALDEIGNLSEDVEDYASDINTLTSRINDADSRINAAMNDLEELVCSPPDAYLSGTFGNYTLHSKASKAGNFTANIHLVYVSPLVAGNATTRDEAMQTFYGSINWTVPFLRDYICTPTYNGAAWGISQVSFNIGTFAMVANTEKTVGIEFGGLNSSYEPDFAYVEVYPIL